MKLMHILAMATVLITANAIEAAPFKAERWKTKNGIPIVYYQTTGVPMLDISIAFKAGSAYDGEHFGLSSLTNQLLNQGNAGLAAHEIAESLADKGSQFSSESNRDMSILSLRTLSEKDALQQSIATFIQIINQPDFPDEAFIQEQKQLLMAIEQAQESPDDVAMITFFNGLYKNHPYAHPVNGTQATVQALTKKEVVDFYQQYYVANNAVLVLVGDIDSVMAHQLAEQITHQLPVKSASAPIPKAQQLSEEQRINIPFPASQTAIRMGQVGIDHHNPHYFPLMVGNYILGGGNLVSRLGTEVREKKGLTYGVTSQFASMPGGGPFIISLATKNDTADEALNLTKATLTLFVKNGPTQNELNDAKRYLTGSFPLSLTSNKEIASLLLRMTFYQLPNDYLDTYLTNINKVSVESIKHAFSDIIDPAHLLVVTVGQS